ncbi:MAG: hypothetical protein GYA14_14105 [Ignavibacteria bacterium]|nr:hypothetical protein [Ignavibacteria bacterium]
MDIISGLNKIKKDLQAIGDNIQILDNSMNGMNILLKGTTGTEYEERAWDTNYELIEEKNYNLTSYPTNLFRQFEVYGKWILRSSESDSTSFLKVEITITTNHNPITLEPIEFYTQSTTYVNRYYDSGINNKIYSEVPVVFFNLNLKWYMSWWEHYSGGEGGGILPIRPPGGGDIPPPIPPPPVPSTAYGKYLYLYIRLF